MIKLLKTTLAYSVILIASCWAIGFIAFASVAISMKYRPLQSTEAIVVLTGGNDRIKESLRLLQEGYAPRLFISGVNGRVTGYHFLKEAAPQIQEKVELGYLAQTTHTNAIETANWVSKNNIRSILLVTSFYHMPRSLLEMHEAVPDLQITPFAVFPKSFGKSTDWIHTRYAWQLFLEYHKFLIVYFFKGVMS